MGFCPPAKVAEGFFVKERKLDVTKVVFFVKRRKQLELSEDVTIAPLGCFSNAVM